MFNVSNRLISADWCGLRSQRGCRSGKRVSTFTHRDIVKEWKRSQRCVYVSPMTSFCSGFLQSWVQACWRWSPHQPPITLTSPTSRRLSETPERESSKQRTYIGVTPVLSVSPVPWHLIRTKCNRNHYGNFGEASPERVEMHESYTDECKDESGEKWEGASKRELLGRLPRYLVFHRHFSKSDQGHQQQHPLSFSLQCSLLLSSVVLFLAI